MSQATQTTPIGAPVEEPAVPVSRPRFMFAFVVLYMLFLLDFSARLGVTSVFPAMQKALGLTDSQIGVAGSAVLDGDGAGITRGLAQAGASGVKVAQVISRRLSEKV